jgi:hypothetical protein
MKATLPLIAVLVTAALVTAAHGESDGGLRLHYSLTDGSSIALQKRALPSSREPLKPGVAFRGSYDVYAHFRPLAADLVETFHVVLLDNKNRFLRTIEVSRGTLTASLVHPRLCFAKQYNRGYVVNRLMWCTA